MIIIKIRLNSGKNTMPKPNRVKIEHDETEAKGDLVGGSGLPAGQYRLVPLSCEAELFMKKRCVAAGTIHRLKQQDERARWEQPQLP